ncbi:glucuronate isomerase [Terribacillus halophilus]|uniref:Uronate isomerase n=1 Tax=Terribacillus halophilus TaxID=361279 RepID=A0A1G6I2G6_9BACI|nr:glucuronate isomerase [Terribacillus halophilus]SDC00674.1 glucuronate isomerase [Terribacillus halophilus]
MKQFMAEDFLLSNRTAERLYHSYAKQLPIIDYHCHLSPKDIYENKQFRNLADVWLDGDHYKWRLMRANGVEEAYITGDKTDKEKFLAWSKTIPMTMGNPVFHWTHLELQRYFDIHEVLQEETAERIWHKANAKLTSGSFGARDMIETSNVEVICTTDDPIDDLEYHRKIKGLDDFHTKVFPSFRPDKALAITSDGFMEWVHQLAEANGQVIQDYDDFLQTLRDRVRYFHEAGGRVSDHALERVVYEKATKEEAAMIYKKATAGEGITEKEENQFKTVTLLFLSKVYKELGWVMQFHIHALRNNSTLGLAKLGPDTGYDAMDDGELAKPLVKFLDHLDRSDCLPKTILYSLNPKDNPVLATVIGSFQGGGEPGKMQLGTAWWFNDQRDGMLDQMKTLSNMGVFGRFIGMLTDSRSFLSYPRHEYFRRLVCDLVGSWVEQGEAPNDEALLAQIVENICYHNAKNYFNFPVHSLKNA